ncbi:hypothetical protein CBL_07130 [Carabus blaptoides fortunei]
MDRFRQIYNVTSLKSVRIKLDYSRERRRAMSAIDVEVSVPAMDKSTCQSRLNFPTKSMCSEVLATARIFPSHVQWIYRSRSMAWPKETAEGVAEPHVDNNMIYDVHL